jgi:hypothetical protein
VNVTAKLVRHEPDEQCEGEFPRNYVQVLSKAQAKTAYPMKDHVSKQQTE